MSDLNWKRLDAAVQATVFSLLCLPMCITIPMEHDATSRAWAYRFVAAFALVIAVIVYRAAMAQEDR